MDDDNPGIIAYLGSITPEIINRIHHLSYLFGGIPTPLKNDGVRQLGLNGKSSNSMVPNHQPGIHWNSHVDGWNPWLHCKHDPSTH